MLISAKEARERADKVAKANFIEVIGEAVIEAVHHGKYTCSVKWNANLDESLKEEIVNTVACRGYDFVAFNDSISIYW